MDEAGLRASYLKLVVEVVNGSIYGGQSYYRPLKPASPWRRRLLALPDRLGITLARETVVPDNAFDVGENWPADRLHVGLSMTGRRRLERVRDLAVDVVTNNVPGDFIEAGVWRGGSALVLKAVVEATGDDRHVYLADSFAGLPATDAGDDAASLHFDETLAVDDGTVRDSFTRFGLLDDRVVFLKGWPSDTLPTVKDRTWSLIRLDGDMYESTMDGLENLYPGLSSGGYLVVDDYFAYNSCRRAVDEYRTSHGITDEIKPIDNQSVYWRKN